MSGEEVIDNMSAVVGSHGTQAGQSRERQRSEELAQCQLQVEVVEVGAGLGALQDGVEGLSVLVNDSGSQRPSGVLTNGGVGGSSGT